MPAGAGNPCNGGCNMGFAARVSIFFAAIFLLIGCHLPYFPVWLDWRGLDAEEIGIILAAPLAVRVFLTPLVAFSADRLANRRIMLVLLAWGALACFGLLTVAHGFWAILTVAMIAAVFWTSIMPLTEAIAMEGVRREGYDYGRMRLWGSLTFIAMSFGGGVVLERWGAPSALWMMIAAAGGIVLAAHMLPAPQGKGRLRKITAVPNIDAGDAVRLIRSRVFLLFLAATGAVQGAHAIYYAFGTLHWQSLGISSGVIGLLWAIGVAAEILLFLFSRRVLERVSPLSLIVLAGLASGVRWSVTALTPPIWLLIPIQVLHGLTFGAAHLGAVHFVSHSVPDAGLGTAQGLYASVTAGIAMGGAIALAGPLYKVLGGEAYLVMAALGVAGAGVAMMVRRMWDGRPLVVLAVPTPDR